MGYLLLPATILLDLLGGYASYYYGASFLPFLLTFIKQWAWPGLLYIVSWPVAAWVHRVPPAGPPSPVPYFQHPDWHLIGLVWVGLFAATHLYYAIKHWVWRYDPTHLGTPQAGNPGEDKWELVKRRWHDYGQAADRFYQKFVLLHPVAWRYTDESSVPIAELRGRQLRIRENALHTSKVRELAPELARLLAKYNSHDWLFTDFLSYYPQRLMLRHLILGIGIWLPTLLKVTAWPVLHWRKRVLVYDQLAWLLGQGQYLYDLLAAQTPYERSFWASVPLMQTRLGQLEALIRTEHKWLQEQHLVDADSEPPILHGPSAAIPSQIDEQREWLQRLGQQQQQHPTTRRFLNS